MLAHIIHGIERKVVIIVILVIINYQMSQYIKKKKDWKNHKL